MELFWILIVVVVIGICTCVNIHRNIYLPPNPRAPRQFYCMIAKKIKPWAPLAESFILFPLLKYRNFSFSYFYFIFFLNLFIHLLIQLIQ